MTFFSVSCSGATKTPNEKDTTAPSNPSYIIAGQSELMEIRNDNVPYFTAADYEKARNGYFMELSSLDKLGRVGSN